MYQVRDKEKNIIIARFLTKKDAETFLKEKKEDGRYIIISAGSDKKKRDNKK